MLVAIWAQAQNGVIGKDLTMPWHLPNDLKFFKEKTLGHTIVLGRKTFEGMGGRPLPNRTTIVVTRDASYETPYDDVIIMNDVESVLSYVKLVDDKVFIAGGAEIYTMFWPHVDAFFRTIIEADIAGDTYFPFSEFPDFHLERSLEGIADEKNVYPHRFELWERD
ncbi:MAG: dihydrofolate reductase [Lactobacillales bacterium]|jgi:dihydrofolate reductase/thymidylate synthase|nr:dihydrofolate reductase [Lactobacillales bacterium]